MGEEAAGGEGRQEAVFAEKGAAGVGLLSHAVGVEVEGVAGLQGEGFRAVLAPRHGAEEESRPGADVRGGAVRRAQAHRRVVARVDAGDAPRGEVEFADPDGDEHVGDVAVAEGRVRFGDGFGDGASGLGEALEDGFGAHHEEGRRDALAADVGDEEDDAVLAGEEEVVEVAADVARGVHAGVEVHPLLRREGREDARDGVALDGGGHRHFPGAAGAQLGADPAGDDESGQRGGEDERRGVEEGGGPDEHAPLDDGRVPRDDGVDGEAFDFAPLPVAVGAGPAPLAALEGGVGVRDDGAARGRDDDVAVLAADVAVVGEAGDGGAREAADRAFAAAGLDEAAAGQPHPDVFDHFAGAGVGEDRLGDFGGAVEEREESGGLPGGGLEVEADVARVGAVGDDAVRAGDAEFVDQQFLGDFAQAGRSGLRVGPYGLLPQGGQAVAEEHGLADETAVDGLADCVLDVREGDVDEPLGIAFGEAVVEEPRQHQRGEERPPDGPREAPGEFAVDLHRGASRPLRSRMTALTASSRSGRPLRTAMP